MTEQLLVGHLARTWDKAPRPKHMTKQPCQLSYKCQQVSEGRVGQRDVPRPIPCLPGHRCLQTALFGYQPAYHCQHRVCDMRMTFMLPPHLVHPTLDFFDDA